MGQKGFVYKGYAYELSDAEWHEKPGNCIYSSTDCGRLVEKKTCKDNLTGHCCKHVVNGNDDEKAVYRDVFKKLFNESDSTINELADNVIDKYNQMSKQVLKDTKRVYLAGESDQIRVICEGDNDTDGITDYLSFVKGEGLSLLGIISSYFNHASIDEYVALRLISQKYKEKRDEGRNVSAVPTCSRNRSGNLEIIQLPLLDEAFKDAPQYYLGTERKDYSAGALYAFYYGRYHEQLCAKYRDLVLENGFVTEKPDAQIWKESCGADNDTIKKWIKNNEKIYQSKVIRDYLSFIAPKDFKPELILGYSQETHMDLGYTIENIDKCVLSPKKKVQYEMILQRYMIERNQNTFKNHYSDCRSSIKSMLNENSLNPIGEGTLCDRTAFGLASSLLNYFIDIYVFAHNTMEIYKGDRTKEEQVKKYFLQWKGFYDSTIFELGSEICEWICIYDCLFEINKKITELSKRFDV